MLFPDHIKYAVIGTSKATGKWVDAVIKMNNESNARIAAALWVKSHGGQALCFAVQNGLLGGRAFHSEGSAA